ncbi:MAG: hypothetical protein ACPG4X_20390 [Pikeienuella sp.]
MTKTQTETVAAAFGHLGINTVGESVDSEDSAYAVGVLDGVIAELLAVQGLTVTFDIADELYLPLSHLLAVEVSPRYGVAPPMSRATAVARVRAAMIDNDLEDRRDTDDDGTISDAEADAGARALYY